MSRPNRKDAQLLDFPRLRTVNTPTALSGNVNNYDGGHTGRQGITVIRLNPNGAARNVTGLLAGYDGQLVLIANVDVTATEDVVLVEESASSSAANRFAGANAASVTIRAKGACLLWYDGTTARWRPVAI